MEIDSQKQIGALRIQTIIVVLCLFGVCYTTYTTRIACITLIIAGAMYNYKNSKKHLETIAVLETITIERSKNLELQIKNHLEKEHAAETEKMAHLYRLAEFGKLASGLFHDLMNPLSAIICNIQNISSGQTNELPKLKEEISYSIKAGKQMEQFLDAVKRQIKARAFMENFLVNDIIEDTLMIVHYKSIQARTTIQFIANEPHYLYNNPLKFQQIISNLLCNAIDACNHLEVPVKRRKISIFLTQTKDSLELKIKDTGCGMSTETTTKIFEPFFSQKKESGGLGIGLSITKNIIENDFHGTILVKSRENKGSCFIVTIPKLLTTTNSQVQMTSFVNE